MIETLGLYRVCHVPRMSLAPLVRAEGHLRAHLLKQAANVLYLGHGVCPTHPTLAVALCRTTLGPQ